MEPQALILLIGIPLAIALGLVLRWVDYDARRPTFVYRGIGYRYDRCSPFLESDLRAVLDALLEFAPGAAAGIWIDFVAGAAVGPYAVPAGQIAKATLRTERFLPISPLHWVVVANRDTTVIRSGIIHEVVYHLARARRGLAISDLDHADPEAKALERRIIDRAIGLGAAR